MKLTLFKQSSTAHKINQSLPPSRSFHSKADSGLYMEVLHYKLHILCCLKYNSLAQSIE